jgi:hypothetical protein
MSETNPRAYLAPLLATKNKVLKRLTMDNLKLLAKSLLKRLALSLHILFTLLQKAGLMLLDWNASHKLFSLLKFLMGEIS